MASFVDVASGALAKASDVQQILDALKGTIGKGIPLSPTGVNDAIAYAFSAKNLDATNSRAGVFYKADGSVLLQIDKNGVVASPDGVQTAAKVVTRTDTGSVSTTMLLNNAVTQDAAAVLGANFSTSSATLVDVTGSAITLTTTGGDVLIEFSGPAHAVTAAGSLAINSDGGDSLVLATLIAGGQTNLPVGIIYRLSGLSAAAHTFKLRASCSGGTLSMNFSSAANGMFRVTELKR